MVKLNDEIETGTTEDNKKEAERLWRIAWAFLRDEFAIQSLHMTGLQYQDIEVRVIDPLRLVGWYTKTSPTEPRLVAYNGQSAPVSFGEWIDSLEMRLALALGSPCGRSSTILNNRGREPRVLRDPLIPFQQRIRDALRTMREEQANEEGAVIGYKS
ncbi:hypothetical protein N7456_010526 [Penicillium angulare]|uniref:Uncharacterized protein n=1 Tax=Penicillium angulare TaxID=116970 RepID=A0A9W9K6K9_9EURO|nr:hypothetical protein N7456_010526 [Penicillium angulare]